MELRWIQISLFLTALLHFTAAATGRTVIVGDDVTLFCENLIRNQPECNYTTWVFSNSTNSETVELVTLGQKKAGSKSDRLSVTEDCSLTIEKVTEEDVGRYVCQQYPTTGEDKPDDAVVDLSLLTMTEMKSSDEVTLCCSVRTFGPCRLRVKWLYEGKDVKEQYQSLKTSHGFCSADVTAPTNHSIYKSGYNSMQCEVSENNNNKQKFPFRRQPSGEDKGHDKRKSTTTPLTVKSTQQTSATETPPKPAPNPRPTENTVTAENTTTPEKNESSDGNSNLGLYIAVPVVLLAALLILVVIIVRRKKREETEIQRNDYNVKDPEEGVSYASIRYTKKNKRKPKTRGKTGDDDAEEGAVTYATVKSSSSSSPADPKSLYPTINKERK